MGQDCLEADAVLGPNAQTLSHQVLAGLGDAASELDARAADLVVLLEGDVALDHVEEEDAEGPDGGWVAKVAVAADPLGGRVHSRPCNRERKNNNKLRVNINIAELQVL